MEQLKARLMGLVQELEEEKHDCVMQRCCCDVFIWVGVWRDVIKYWVLSSDDVAGNKYYSTGQHRGNTGEGQIHVKDSNLSEFVQFESAPRVLIDKICEAFERQKVSGGVQ